MEKYLKLLDFDSSVGKKIKEAYNDLDKKVAIKYNEFTRNDIKNIVINEKWIEEIETDIHTEIEMIGQRLSKRIRLLAERYEVTLPQLEGSVTNLENKVIEHLKNMGFKW